MLLYYTIILVMVLHQFMQKKQPDIIILSYTFTACEDKETFYDQVEIMLCGKLKSGFGRNLDALYDGFSGGFGLLDSSKVTNIRIKKSKILNPKIKKILQDNSNEFIIVHFE